MKAAKTIKAVYEKGVFRPLRPVRGMPEHQPVRIIPETKKDTGPRLADLQQFIGCLSHEEAEEMIRIIDEEFGKVDPREW